MTTLTGTVINDSGISAPVAITETRHTAIAPDVVYDSWIADELLRGNAGTSGTFVGVDDSITFLESNVSLFPDTAATKVAICSEGGIGFFARSYALTSVDTVKDGAYALPLEAVGFPTGVIFYGSSYRPQALFMLPMALDGFHETIYYVRYPTSTIVLVRIGSLVGPSASRSLVAMRITRGMVELVIEYSDTTGSTAGLVMYDHASNAPSGYPFGARMSETTSYIMTTTQYEIQGSILRFTTGDRKVITAMDSRGTVMYSDVITADTYQVISAMRTPLYISVYKEGQKARKNSSQYMVGDTMVAADTTDVPYYYECVTAGITGTAEPALPRGHNEEDYDGTAVWKNIGPFKEPFITGPLVPTEIIT